MVFTMGHGEPHRRKFLYSLRKFPKMRRNVRGAVKCLCLVHTGGRSIAVLIAATRHPTHGIDKERRSVGRMSKPKMLGYYKPYVPNSKADRKRTKPFGTNKKGKKK